MVLIGRRNESTWQKRQMDYIFLSRNIQGTSAPMPRATSVSPPARSNGELQGGPTKQFIDVLRRLTDRVIASATKSIRPPEFDLVIGRCHDLMKEQGDMQFQDPQDATPSLAWQQRPHGRLEFSISAPAASCAFCAAPTG